MEKICAWCNKPFETKYANKMYCSRSCQAKMYRYRKINNIDSSIKICPKCGKEFKIKSFAYERRYCYDCIPEYDHKLSGSELRKIIKQWAVEEKGGKCQCCGYDNCIEALEFHHLNPNEKDFTLSDRNLITDWDLIKPEIDKCILVCANCHREIHAGKREV